MRFARTLLLICAVALAPLAAGAECRLALALGFDVSRSISPKDYAIQRDGIVAALADPVVRQAFLGSTDHVAVAVFEWSGQERQSLIADWTAIRSADDILALQAQVAGRQREPKLFLTGLGGALIYAHALMQRAPHDCRTRVLDISGDGRNNDGPSPGSVYAALDFGDITVNGLAIGEHESGLLRYFEAQLIRGPDAFVEEAVHQRDFPQAIRRKLLRELGERMIGRKAVPLAVPHG
jgi:Protein of unknown function (DUF1194)